MKYYVKNISGSQYTGTVTIKVDEESEVDKETYEYLNDTFGSLGMFTFRTTKATKPVKKPTQKVTKVEEAVTSEATPKESTKASNETE